MRIIISENTLNNNFLSNFKNWFANSKVVDKNGNPMVCYHGTRKGGFLEFKPKEGYKGHSKQQLDLGSHFSIDKEYSKTYAGDGKNAKVYECFLRIQNPLETNIIVYREDDETKFHLYFNFTKKVFGKKMRVSGDDFYNKNGEKMGIPQNIMINSFLIDSIPSGNLYNGLKNFGFDGVFHTPYNRESITHFKSHPLAYVVLDANQIKSTENDGSFDIDDNNIYS